MKITYMKNVAVGAPDFGPNNGLCANSFFMLPLGDIRRLFCLTMQKC